MSENAFYSSPIFGAIIGGLIVGVITLYIMLFKEKKIEPEKWKKNVKFEKLTKKLEVYGRLNTLLDAGTERIKRQNQQEGEKDTHLIEMPHDLDKLQQIFEGPRYLLSENLIKTYLDFVREDKFFSDISSRKNDPSVIFCDLSEMHKIAQEEFDEINKELEEMIK